MSEHDWTKAAEMLHDPRLQAELHARSYGRPGKTFESALALGPLWLGEEIRYAEHRGDIDSVRNLGMAGFVLFASSDDSTEQIQGRAAFDRANRVLLEAKDGQQG